MTYSEFLALIEKMKACYVAHADFSKYQLKDSEKNAFMKEVTEAMRGDKLKTLSFPDTITFSVYEMRMLVDAIESGIGGGWRRITSVNIKSDGALREKLTTLLETAREYDKADLEKQNDVKSETKTTENKKEANTSKVASKKPLSTSAQVLQQKGGVVVSPSNSSASAPSTASPSAAGSSTTLSSSSATKTLTP